MPIEELKVLKQILSSLGGVSDATTPTVYNVIMTLADTEYSQLLPDNTKIVEFRC